MGMASIIFCGWRRRRKGGLGQNLTSKVVPGSSAQRIFEKKKLRRENKFTQPIGHGEGSAHILKKRAEIVFSSFFASPAKTNENSCRQFFLQEYFF